MEPLLTSGDRLRVGCAGRGAALGPLGFSESRRRSRDTYPESYITKYTIFEIYEDKGDRIDVIGPEIPEIVFRRF